MSLAIIWLSSSISCIILDKINGIRVFKVAADEGYKINIEKLLMKNKDKYTRTNKITNLICLCTPVYNIYHIVQKTLIFNSNKKIRNCISDNLNLSDALELMNELDLESYSKDKTLKNAVKISLNSKSILNQASIIDIDDCRFYYGYDENKGLIIYKVDGYYKYLTINEQKRILSKEINKIENEMIDISKYFEKLSSFDDIKERKERIVKLRELKNQLTHKTDKKKSNEKQKGKWQKNFV